MQLPMNNRHFVADGTTTGFDGRGFEYVDLVLEWGRRFDMPVLPSVHAAPGVQVRDWNA